MRKGFSDFLMAFLVIAIATTLVLPGRPVPDVIVKFFDMWQNVTKVVLGTNSTTTQQKQPV